MKKGISPLIATVLIIGFTVAIAAIIITFGTDFIKKLSEKTEEEAKLSELCSKVNFDIKRECIYGLNVETTIENIGTNIEGFVFRIYGTNKTNVEERKGLSTGGIKLYQINFDPKIHGIPRKMEVIPFVKVGNRIRMCDVYSEEDLFPCYRLSIITENLEEWDTQITNEGIIGAFPLEEKMSEILSGEELEKIKSLIENLDISEEEKENLLSLAGKIKLKDILSYLSELKIETFSENNLLVLPTEEIEVILTSPSFNIPKEVNYIHYKGYIKGNYTFEVISGDEKQIITNSSIDDFFKIDMPVELINEGLKGKRANVRIHYKGSPGKFLLISEICFAREKDEKCII